MNDPFTDSQASLFTFCKDFASEMKLAGVSADLQVFKFDAHVENVEFPETDLIGPSGLSLDIDDSLVTVRTAIGISTLDDMNIFRLDTLLGAMLRKLKPGAILTLLDAQTGQGYGAMKVLGQISVLPVQNDRTRSFKAVALALGLDHAFV
jgi:hypothetical protein